jgi:cytochrome oxidase Cu insertion factor (SCO1/SenC/PrrC family)
MNAWAVRGWLMFAALLAVLYAGFVSVRADRESAQFETQSSTAMNPETDDKVDDFVLTDQSGQPFGMAELKGKVWIASFFFASCPATCRQLNLALAAAQEATPNDVMLVSLTCDPDNDTPEQLTRYSEVFHADPARWKFLTGDMADLRRAGRDIFKVAFEKQVHSERAFVVDRDGRIRARYSVLDRAQADNMIKFVRELDGQAASVESTPAETPTEEQQAAVAPSP